MEQAGAETLSILPKSLLGAVIHYLLAQQAPLRRCLEQARAELSTNAVERAIRPSETWGQVCKACSYGKYFVVRVGPLERNECASRVSRFA